MPWTPDALSKTKSRSPVAPVREQVMEFAPLALGQSALDRIIGQSAPMRELKRNIERAAHCQCILLSLSFNAAGEAITTHHVEAEFRRAAASLPSPASEPVDGSMRAFIQSQERQRLAFIERAIDREHGNVTAAAERLKIQRAALYKMRERLARRVV